MKENKIAVCEIERFAIHDGPGIRTTVFLQGCPLRCEWCANPESQAVGRHIMTFSNKCNGCGKCTSICPLRAITLEEGKAVINRTLCDSCGKCAEVCPKHAIGISGKIISCEELYRIIIRDKDYYTESGGGLTLSGGEALLQIEQIRPLLLACRKQEIHIAVETCGCVSLNKVITAFPFVDLFLFDIKSLDADKLREYTGGELNTILACFEFIAASNPDKLIIRVPVIPGFNYNEKDITDIFEFALQKFIKEIHLLPYHALGVSKYEQLGRKYPISSKISLRNEELNDLKEKGECLGLTVKIGG
jgi:pyruvate formate lyase activating enzyme